MIYSLFGTNNYAKNQFILSLSNKLGIKPTTKYAFELSSTELPSLLGGGGLFNIDQNFITIKSLDMISLSQTGLIQEIEKALKFLPQDDILILNFDRADKRKSFYKQLTKISETKEFNTLSESECRSWLNQLLKATEVTLPPNIISEIIRRFSCNQDLIKNFVSLISNSASAITTPEQLDKFVDPVAEDQSFNLIELSLNKNTNDLINAINNLKVKDAEVFALLGLITAQIYSLLLASIYRGKNISENIFASELGLNPYIAKKNYQLLSRTKTDYTSIATKVDKSYQVDLLSKTTTADTWKLLEWLLLP